MHKIAENTIRIMLEKKLQIRDTLFPYSESDRQYVNLDNYYKNGNKYVIDDPFKVEIIWEKMIVSGGKIGKKGEKVYNVPGCNSVAYDLGPISIHPRYSKSNGSHAIAHELVHRIQHITMQEEQEYIDYNGKNWIEYISQRAELEAHYVQCIYMSRYNHQWLKTNIVKQFPDGFIEIILKIEDLTNKSFSTNIAKEIIIYFTKLNLTGETTIKPSYKNNGEIQPLSISFTAEEFHQLIKGYIH